MPRLLQLGLGLILLAGACRNESGSSGGEGGGEGDVAPLGPRFTEEPPSLVQYLARRGARVQCAATGRPPPALSWLRGDGAPLHDGPGRRVLSNGTLEILPGAGGGEGGGGGGGGTVRCRAANVHGALVSRLVRLQPVFDESWEAEVSAAPAARGGVAALRCRARPGVGAGAGEVELIAWYRGDVALDVGAPGPESRYLQADDALLVRDAGGAGDAGPYSCVARHRVAGTRRSPPAVLVLTAGAPASPPRLVVTASEVTARVGAALCIPCVASDYPLPQYTWYREAGGRLQPVGAGGGSGAGAEDAWLWAGGAALCLSRVARRHAGAWLCKAYNGFGDATAQTRLDVVGDLHVTIEPEVAVVAAGGAVRFQCNASDPAATLRWLHDGAPVGGAGGAVLRLEGVSRAHRGVYQCEASRGAEQSHAAADLRLGDSAPELVYTFIEQALRGGDVALRCVAAGAPPPRLAWLLDGRPLAERRAQLLQRALPSGDVAAELRLTAVSAADGGRYTCRATNALGTAEHSARLNVYGPPAVRALGPVHLVAGTDATVYCPYAGYPISSVSWRRAGVALGAAGRVAVRGAELRLRGVHAGDAGRYTCEVRAAGGGAARGDVDLQVHNPPKISPFIFSSELTEGSSVQVLCGVSSGDKPVYFSWLKDGAPIPPDLQIEEKSLNEFSLLMFSELSARHSGEYTCRVTNRAASAAYSAALRVRVPPSWSAEPRNTSVLLGAPLQLTCAARGAPPPAVRWHTRLGTGEDESADKEGEDQWVETGGEEWRVESAGGAGTLSAPAASRRHRGQYRCSADNGVGTPLTKLVTVGVHEPAHFATTSGGNTSAVRGRGAELACEARGDAPLALRWTHRGRELDLHSYRTTVSEVRTAGGLRSALHLRATEPADAGEYRCHAENQFGRSEHVMYLHVEEAPGAARSVRLRGLGARWVQLAWRGTARAHYSARLEALGERYAVNLTLDAVGESRLPVDADSYDTFSSRIDDLRPAVSYTLRIVAGNRVGLSPPSEPLLFTTLEEAPDGPPRDVHVRPADAGELRVTWSAPPPESWNGELLGYVATWREQGRSAAEAGGGEAGDAEEAEDPRRGGVVTAPARAATLQLAGLRPRALYAVSLRAFNRAGAGPAAPPALASTADGVPEEPLQDVRCEPASARALRVHWSPPAGPERSHDVEYAPVPTSPVWSTAASPERVRAAAGADVTLQGLLPGTNYSVWVRARGPGGAGPPSAPTPCATSEDAPGAPGELRALAAGVDAVLVAWLPPPAARRGGALSHYTLYARELGKAGGEWAQRVEAPPGAHAEAWREVRGLRARRPYEFWVRAATAAGAGPASAVVTATPEEPAAARIWSVGRAVGAWAGAALRLPCGALGAGPLRRRWSPPPLAPAHRLTDAGDLLIHKADELAAGNYTCSVRNAAGADAVVFAVAVGGAPAAPAAPRLARAARHELRVAWAPPPARGAPLLGYTVWWSRLAAPGAVGGAAGGAVRWARAGAGDATLALRGLACGARYRVWLRAHSTAGASPPSAALLATTRGEKVKAASGKECIWANATTLRVNLLTWGGGCPARSWSVALRPAAGGAWRDLPTDGEAAAAHGLRPATWYELRVRARSAAGDTRAAYRAATLSDTGDRLGEPESLPVAAAPDTAGGERSHGGGVWRGGEAAAVAGGALLTALVVGAVGALLARRLNIRTAPAARAGLLAPHDQLYSTEPKRNGKTLASSEDEVGRAISPYATFSMGGPLGGEAGEGGGCARVGREGALHLRTFGCGEAAGSAAAPGRPGSLARSIGVSGGRGDGSEYRRDSDSESSGSSCAACSATRQLHALQPLYRAPLAQSPRRRGGGGGGTRGLRGEPRRELSTPPAPTPAPPESHASRCPPPRPRAARTAAAPAAPAAPAAARRARDSP